MAEKPILMSTLMVQALLDGRKTQTRRSMKPQPVVTEQTKGEPFIDWSSGGVACGAALPIAHHSLTDLAQKYDLCPYGQPGDLIYVRETWKPTNFTEDYEVTIQFKVGEPLEIDVWQTDQIEAWDNWQTRIMNELDKKGKLTVNDDEESVTWDPKDINWKSSIHMPKDAARIWLKVVEVRVERASDIAMMDAVDEGVQPSGGWWRDYMAKYTDSGIPPAVETPQESFKSLWENINGEKSWKANPWVWVVVFKVISTTGKP